MKDEAKKDRAASSDRPQFPRLRAKKSLGQNFLTDVSIVDRIVRAIDPSKNETIIEIGPGHGELTGRLIEKSQRVVAIEFDRDLVPLLKTKFTASKSFIVLEDDALLVDLCAAIAPELNARVVANLPYYISTAILQRLLEQRSCLTELTLMLQREVANRITAAPGTSDRGYLSVLVEAYGEVEKLFDVPPDAFRPIPKVWSTIVRIKVRRRIAVDVKDEPLLWRVVSVGFAQRRKTILNNLRNAQVRFQDKDLGGTDGVRSLLESAGIDQRRRAETITLEEWARLANALSAINDI